MSNKEKVYDSMIVTTKEISEILGLSDRRIRQLENEGALIKVGHGKFNLPESIQRYIEVIKEQSETEEEADYNKERTLLTRANRQKVEMELKILQGEVHRSEDVEQVMNEMLSSFRAQMLVIPGKVAPQLIAQTDVEVIKSLVKNYVYEGLQELSDYDPNIFYAKSKDKLSIDDDIEENTGEEKTVKAEKEPQKNVNKRKSKK